MKFLIVFLAFAGLSMAAPSSKSLKDDLMEFVNLIPREEMRAVACKYLASDAEFQHVVEYLRSPEWAALVQEVRNKEAVQKLSAYMLQAGIDLKKVLEYIHNIIANPNCSKVAAPRSVAGFLEEIKQLIPANELIVLLNIKLNTSPEFIEFWGKVTSEDAHQLVEEVRHLEEVQRIAAVLKGMGIDLTAMLEKIYEFLGWN